MARKSLGDCVEEGLPPSYYYDQFETVKALEVDGVYVQGKGTWYELTYRIFYVGHGIAVGECIASKAMGDLPVGKKAMFHAEGYRMGWKYRDDRPAYRLQDK